MAVKSLGTMPLRSAGLAAFLEQGGETSLFVSSFAALLSDAVYRIDGLTKEDRVVPLY